MKATHAAVSIIIAVTVLLLAYAVGRFIRSVRLSHVTPTQQVSNEPQPKRTTQPTPEERAKIKDARVKELEASRNLTPDQKEQRREAVVEQLTPTERPDANRPAGRMGRGAARPRITAVPQPPADVNGNRAAPPVANQQQDTRGVAPAQDANSSK
jgi:hypothetical protein